MTGLNQLFKSIRYKISGRVTYGEVKKIRKTADEVLKQTVRVNVTELGTSVRVADVVGKKESEISTEVFNELYLAALYKVANKLQTRVDILHCKEFAYILNHLDVFYGWELCDISTQRDEENTPQVYCELRYVYPSTLSLVGRKWETRQENTKLGQ